MKLEVLILILLQLTRISGGPCTKSEWRDSEAAVTSYVIKITSKKKFNDAENECRKMGGHLVIIIDKFFQKFMMRFLKNTPNSTAYYIGLRKQGPRAVTGWVDGSVLNETHYANWDDPPPLAKLFCVVVKGCCKSGLSWHVVDCDTPRPFVCQSTNPCERKPVMRVNAGLWGEAAVAVTHKQEVYIGCYVSGRQETVYQIEISCGDGGNNKYQGLSKAQNFAKFKIDRSMHGKTCKCEAIPQAEESKYSSLKAEVYFSFRTNPRFLHESEDKITRIVKRLQDSKAVIKFKFYAYPIPEVYNLTHDGQEPTREEYILDVDKSLNDPLEYSVKIKLEHLLPPDAGQYVFTVDNGIPPPLTYNFEIKIIRYDGVTGIVILVTIVVLFSVTMMACVIGRWMIKVKREESLRRSTRHSHRIESSMSVRSRNLRMSQSYPIDDRRFSRPQVDAANESGRNSSTPVN